MGPGSSGFSPFGADNPSGLGFRLVDEGIFHIMIKLNITQKISIDICYILQNKIGNRVYKALRLLVEIQVDRLAIVTV